jgi:alkanesulfonate monooxygenase SsuD/methylene tetrahydromethanopterin reductase-like flavin-dependent oxidoreductase (luciferase family)
VPILVGGHSRAAARRAARYGDGFYPLTAIVDSDIARIDFLQEIKRMIGILKEECEKVGRKFDGFELTAAARPDFDFIRRLEDIGVARACLNCAESDRDAISRTLEKIGDQIIARL